MSIFQRVLAAAAFLSVGSAASAADMAVPAYRVTPATLAYNWTGLYVGVHGGWYSIGGNVTFVGVTDKPDRGDGGFGGGQVGVNWQAIGSPLVFGLESDISFKFTDKTDDPSADWLHARVRPWGTARVRVGYAADRALWYATGGLAWAENKVTANLPTFGIRASETNTHTGWTIGGGFEWAFADLWSAKVEYLYLKLGNESFLAGALGAPLEADLNIHTVKGGLNYRFGGQTPVMAKY